MTNIIMKYPVVQVGWTVFGDMETAVERWTKMTGAGPFFVLPNVPLLNVNYRGRPTEFDHTSAVTQWGGVQLELMLQHCDNPSHVREISPDGKPRLGNVSWYVPDVEEETRRLEGLGFPKIWSCNVFDESMSATWFDARDVLGCFVEVFLENEMMRRAGAQCAKAAENWDGVRPFRPMMEMMEIEI